MNLPETSGVLRVISRRRKASDSNLIPLINIVFLLLVFFMVAGQIQSRDGSDIQAPSSDEVDVGASPLADVQINRRNEIFLGGESMSLERLKTVLSEQRHGTAEHLLVKADRDVKAADLGVLLDALRSSGIGSIRLMTERSGN